MITLYPDGIDPIDRNKFEGGELLELYFWVGGRRLDQVHKPNVLALGYVLTQVIKYNRVKHTDQVQVVWE